FLLCEPSLDLGIQLAEGLATGGRVVVLTRRRKGEVVRDSLDLSLAYAVLRSRARIGRRAVGLAGRRPRPRVWARELTFMLECRPNPIVAALGSSRDHVDDNESARGIFGVDHVASALALRDLCPSEAQSY